MPGITVLLSAGREPSALRASAESLFAQNLTDFELLLLDDGEGEAAGQLAGQDSRVRIVRTERAGLGAALNRGLAQAQGELIVRVVAGDVSAPDRLARQAGLLAVAPELAFVATGWRSVGTDGVVWRAVSPPAADPALRAAMATGDVIGHPTAMMRREAVMRVGGWRPAFAGLEDYDLLLRLLDRQKGACVSEAQVEVAAPGDVLGWRELEQRVLSEMAAVAAHDRRQVGRPDHGDRQSPVDRGTLHRMGMAEDEIGRSLTARALSAAMAAGTARQWRTMREAARLGLQQDALPRALRSRFAGLWLRGLARIQPVIPAGPGKIATSGEGARVAMRLNRPCG